jgi:hypothetical protein
LAGLTGAGIDRVETGLILLVALLVEMGGLGPFVTMHLAKAPRPTKVPPAQEPTPKPKHTASGETSLPEPLAGMSPSPLRRPMLIYSASENLESDLGRFLSLHTRPSEGSTLGSTDLLASYNGWRRQRGCPPVTQRRFGDAMSALGYRDKPRLCGGRVHYLGLAWADTARTRVAA